MNPLKGKAFEYGHSPLISSCHLCRGRNTRRCTLVSCPCQLFCLCRQIKPFLFLLPLSHCQFLISLNLLWDQREGVIGWEICCRASSAVENQQSSTACLCSVPLLPELRSKHLTLPQMYKAERRSCAGRRLSPTLLTWRRSSAET